MKVTKFPNILVGELVVSGEAELKTGPFGTQLKASEYTDYGTPVINVRNIGFGSIKPDKLEFISPSTRDRLSSHVLRSGDIVFGRKGAVERHVFIRHEQNGWFQGSDCLRLRFKSHRVEPLFASYFFLTAEHQRWMMNQCSHGATMASLNQEILERIGLPLPPLPIQQRIAGILSAYDELIENNQRRIKILEGMARGLYREWFVHFRFSGYETHPCVASPQGEMPKGWEVRTLAELCSRMESGGTPRRNKGEYWEGGEIDWYKTGELWDGFLFGSQEQITVRGQRESTARLFEPGTILMAIYGSPTVGRMGILTRAASCNQAALGLVANIKLISQNYLYFVLFSLREHFNSLAQGAAQQNISKEKVASALAILPPRDILEQFDRKAEPIFLQIKTLQRQVQNLRRTRDLLLPRLLSGQINVEAP